VPLFQRLRKGVVLTDAGRRLAESGRTLNEQFSAVLRSVRDAGGHPQGEVRCLLPVGLPPLFVAIIYRLFNDNWPRLRMRADLHPAPLSAELSNVDVLIWFGTADPPAEWVWKQLFDIPIRLFASKDYLDEHGTPTTARELAAHPVLAWLPPGEAAPELISLEGAPRQLAPTFVTSDVHLLHDCARANLGIVWAPDGGLPQYPGFDPFIGVLEEKFASRTELRLAVPAALAKVPKVRVFLDAVDLIRENVPTNDT
jgi:DNA-binding transcriptional LysR family regulator